MPQNTHPETVLSVESNSKYGIRFRDLITGKFSIEPNNTPPKSVESNGKRGIRFGQLITGRFTILPIETNGRSQKSKKTKRRWLSGRKPVVWGIFIALLGVIFLITALWWEEGASHALLLQLLGHIAIAFIILGIVGIAVEVKQWTEYFEERLASTISKKEFLRTLKDQELDSLLEDIFLSRFKVDRFDANSFLHFFTAKIQRFIGSSFRENVTRSMTIESADTDGFCLVRLDVGYKCRKIAGESSTIQEDVIFRIDKPDIKESPRKYEVTLKTPDDLRTEFSSPLGFPPCIDGKIVITNSDFEKLKLFNKGEMVEPEQGGNCYKFKISLEDFSDMDGLEIQQYAEYYIPAGRFNSWSMASLSKGVSTIFKYPQDEFECKVESLGMDTGNQNPVDRPGLYRLDTDSWVLPECGIAYGFFKKTKTDDGQREAKEGRAAQQKPNGNESNTRPYEPPRQEDRERDEFVLAHVKTNDGDRVAGLLVRRSPGQVV
jgi:hypothetical protein